MVTSTSWAVVLMLFSTDLICAKDQTSNTNQRVEVENLELLAACVVSVLRVTCLSEFCCLDIAIDRSRRMT